MKLKIIKGKSGNKSFTESVNKTIQLIKSTVGLTDNAPFYLLSWYRFRQIYLSHNTIYIASIKFEYTKDNTPILETLRLSELYSIKLLKEYPKSIDDIEFKVINHEDNKYCFTPEQFLNWIDEPSDINTEVDMPYYEAVKFFNKYSNETFRTERYLFYPKPDNDSNFITNIYAYDLKYNAEMKLYTTDRWKQLNSKRELIPPETVFDIAVDDLSDKLSTYQKRQCKKAFLKFANEYNPKYKVKNYWLIEFVKLAVQPVEILHEWSIHRIFAGKDDNNKPKKFTNIWVPDFLDKDEEPYFFLTDSPYTWETTKVASINFKSASYHFNSDIYKQNNVKFKNWKLDEKYIKELMAFLKSPADIKDSRRYYDKYVKTNWQQLIFEYNSNTAGWGWGDTGFDIPPEQDKNRTSDIEALPFDLPIPDYTKLLKD